MAGSQLKNLKRTLKENGLTGQANVKGSKNAKKKPREHDREERAKVIAKIREQFNPFEIKVNRNKKEAAGSKNDKKPVGKPGISKQIGEDQRRQAYELRNSRKNKNGGIVDRRFGEKNKHLSSEEKMLERFTRERQHQSSSKKSLFNLDDDEDDDIYGEKLTHYGKSLALEDDFDEGDLGLSDDNDGVTKSSKSKWSEHFASEDEQPRKKTKAEVMQEVIAKSKFYKHERQKAQEELEDQIGDLDEDFEDVMSALNALPKKKLPVQADDVDKGYDIKVKELNLERRAAPADRTKTEEELRKEDEERRQKLEQDRINRMSGMVNFDDERGVEDLDDGFWGGDDSEEEMYGEDEDDLVNSDNDVPLSDDEHKGHVHTKASSAIPCPSSHAELLGYLEDYPFEEHPKLVKNIIRKYQPRFAEGNNTRLGVFTGILLKHILFLSTSYDAKDVQSVKDVENSMITTLKVLSEKYNEPLSITCREIIEDMQERFKSQQYYGLKASDLVFFTLVGCLFSTSDHYHLVVTPCSILIGEFLEQIKLNTFQKLIFCAVLARISLQYQRISKRFVPELAYFFEKSLISLLPSTNDVNKAKRFSEQNTESCPLNLPEQFDFESMPQLNLNLRMLFKSDFEFTDEVKVALLFNILESLDQVLCNIWKELSAFKELVLPFKPILEEYVAKFPSLEKAKGILEKIERLERFQEHYPLSLQNHKPVSIPTYAPKYEDNFNPEKKSYDPDRSRNELNKMKAQIKKERKFTMKEIRKDTKFEARKQIDAKKKEQEEYHAKMARIINTISTEEGREKSKYEREKKLRSSKK